MRSITRRELLRTGFGGSVLLMAASACAPRTVEPPLPDRSAFRVLDGAAQAIFAALAPVILDGALPKAAPAHQAAVEQSVRGVDVAVAGLPPSVQDELRQLLGMLTFPLTRWLLAGISTSWSAAAPGDVTAFLKRWRYSNIALFRSGYDALHQLVMAGWYGGDAAWPHMGYPGPPRLA